ncbi:MAG: tetratricopeptide repeat protein, partial [Planctomycetes bacterium]|nr:tetratricopeptide repeat protein [Planctomycetota bacterium]
MRTSTAFDMMKPIAPLLILLIFAAPSVSQPTDARTLVDEANHALADGDYDKALEGYVAAEVTHPELPELAYNQALAHYRLGNYETARTLFNKALATRDLTLEGKAKYNLGNTAYASALEKLSNMPKAIEYLKTAIGRYRDALEIAPEDEDAEANIETAQLLIKDLFDKLKQ